MNPIAGIIYDRITAWDAAEPQYYKEALFEAVIEDDVVLQRIEDLMLASGGWRKIE